LKLYSYISFIVSILFFTASQGYTQPLAPARDQKPARILYLVDVSSSMMYNWQGTETRMKTVGRLLNDITDSLLSYNDRIEFGLRLIGSQYPAQRKVCTDTRLEVPFGTVNATEIIKGKVSNLKPYGFTPIAYALQQAALYDFVNSQDYNYSIILITDGGESCNGDICATMKEMVDKKISFKPYILSLVKDSLLSGQYACMGTYINVLEPGDFNIAIQKIINENKTKLHIPETRPQEKKPIVVKTDPPPTPVVRPRVDTPASRPVARQETPVAVKPDTPDRVQAPVVEMKEMYRLPFRRTPRKYTIILAENALPRPRLVFLKMNFPAPPEEQPVASRPVTPKDAATSRPTPVSSVKIVETPPQEMTVTNELTPAEKTQLRVQIVTRQGKPIYAEPLMTITNARTKTKRQERRLVTAGSKAIKPIDIEAGSYTLQIGNSKDYTHEFTIAPNQMNTVTIVVNPSSLAFQYEPTSTRPVKEYRALVSDRFSQQRSVTEQPCDTKLFYEPASYHVEVNTMPPTMYFLDLEMGVTKVITIPENGTLKITNSAAIGRVELYYQLGDAYKFFHYMVINGNPASQELGLLPGAYQVRYIKPGSTQQVVVPFRIISLRNTPLEL